MHPRLLHILQHSLGVNGYGIGPQYRNHFCATFNSPDFILCTQLVVTGYMHAHGSKGELTGGSHLFTVTPQGIAAVAMHSPPAPTFTRSQLRYRQWLNLDTGQSFSDWIGAHHKPRKASSY